jgi:hypothetical protein
MTTAKSHAVDLLSSLWCLLWVAFSHDVALWAVLTVAATTRFLTVLWIVTEADSRVLGLGVLTLHLFLPVLVAEL